MDTILLDKTGTVTTGRLAVDGVHGSGGRQRAEVLRWPGPSRPAPSTRSPGPSSRRPAPPARLAARRRAGTATTVPCRLRLPQPRAAAYDGDASDGRAGGRGAHRLAAENGIAPGRRHQRASCWVQQEAGATAIWVAVDGETAGIISLRDTVKDGSAAAITRLKELGLRPILLTGDNAAVAAQVAAAVGIAADDVFADVLPEEQGGRGQAAAGRGRHRGHGRATA